MSIDLLPHQQEAVEQFWKSKIGIAWHKVGEGKTRIAVALAERVRQLSGSESGVWFAILRRKAFWDLQNELKKTNILQHWKVAEFTGFPERGEIKGWNLWMISHAILQKYEKEFSKDRFKSIIKFIYIDELYLYSNPKSSRSISCRKLCEITRARRIGVSGTIMPTEDNTSVWGQTRALCVDQYLARSLTSFRSEYQICSITDLQRYKIVKRINKPRSIESITKKLGKFVHIYFPANTRTLTDQTTNIPLTKEQIKWIKQILKDYYYELEDKDGGGIRETRTALEVATRLRQISSGWLPNPNPDLPPFRIPTNKTIVLKEAVDELLAAGESVLIWTAFRYDVEIVSSLFEIPVFQMVGGKDFDADLYEKLRPKITVATESSGSSVNHFKDIRYVIYYSYNYDWLSLSQSKGRTDRKDGKHNECHYQFLICDSPGIDSQVLENARVAGSTETTFLKVFKQFKDKYYGLPKV